ncbi:MAG TPA: hypothetical protein VLQ89_07015 [Candidatus Binatia bacterium]|nr:hypothetical protein [Candidatus Binatia bacterium]
MKKRMRFPLPVVFLLAALAVALSAGEYKNTAGGVSLWLPDEWEIDNDELEGAIYADAPEGDAFCVLQVLVNDNDLTAALSTYSDVLSDEMDTFTVTAKGAPKEVNGLGIIQIKGEGLRDEKTWTVDVQLVSTGKAVLMCALGWEKDKEETFAFLREKILPSLKALD